MTKEAHINELHTVQNTDLPIS